ncbi:MAG: response regulator [Chromatiales bacterium]|nr:response regulator [Chromatiales bacterium]
MCDGLVQAMGGRLGLTSEPSGRGSTFEFALTRFPLGGPLRPGRACWASPTAGASTAATSSSPTTTSPLGRELLRQMLVDLGCAVDVAADGDEALARARDTVYDLILMDVQMPRLDGLSAARAMRGVPPAHGHTPIVALTASDLRRGAAAVLRRQHERPPAQAGHGRDAARRALQLARAVRRPPAAAPRRAAASQDGGTGPRPAGLDGNAMLSPSRARAIRDRERMVREHAAHHLADVPRLREHVAAGPARRGTAPASRPRRVVGDDRRKRGRARGRGGARRGASQRKRRAGPARRAGANVRGEVRWQSATSLAPARGADARH